MTQRKDLAYHLTEHLRLNGVYWGLTALHIMGQPDGLDRDEMIEYVMSCWDDEAGQSILALSFHSFLAQLFSPSFWVRSDSHLGFAGTFGAHPGHDGHILATLSAIQILLLQNALDRIEINRVVSCPSLPLPTIPPSNHY